MFGAVRKRAAAGHPPSSGLRPPSPQGEGSKRGRLPSKGKAFAYDKGGHPIEYRKVISRDNDYILHTYGRSQVVLAEGEGMTARDADGKSYLLTSRRASASTRWATATPRGSGAVADQAATLQHTSNLYYTAPRRQAGEKALPPHRLDAVFFGNSGAEANEGAIKCARKYSVDTYGESRNKVITLVNSFHGRTLATLTATGQDVFHHDFGPSGKF